MSRPPRPESHFDVTLRRAVRAHVRAWAHADDRAAVRVLSTTALVYAIGLGAGPWCLSAATARSASDPAAWGLGLAGVALTALLVGTLVRVFMIHHDLCHHAFFSSRWMNRAVAPFVGALVSTSPSVWSREHDRHHKDSNNLDKEQDGQTASWTTARYLAAPSWQRALYWVANQPVVLFGLLPPLYFLGFMRVRARLYENVVFAAWAIALWRSHRLVYFLVAVALASLAGFLLFHAQHTFDGAYRRRGADYVAFDNGLLGSSYLVLPTGPVLGGLLRWCAYSVEYHHAHHLHPRIPGYHLARCHREAGALFDAVPRVTLGSALRTMRYALFDEATGRFESLREAGRVATERPTPRSDPPPTRSARPG